MVFLQACDPKRNCNQPTCLYSNVLAEPIEATLTGNLDSIINIGDTLRLYMKIPDTLRTNYGNVVFGNLLDRCAFSFTAGVGDSIIGNAILANPFQIPKIFIKYGTGSSNQLNQNAPSWEPSSREFECLLITNKKGKCIIDLKNGLISMKAIDGKEWLVNVPIKITNEKRYNQYLSWVNQSNQVEALSLVFQKKGWYCFEVQ
jgi:hypothetical protein